MTTRNLIILISSASVIAYLIAIASTPNYPTSSFDGARAYDDVITQVSYGPRIPGSSSHAKAVQFITDSIRDSEWNYKLEDDVYNGYLIKNIIAFRENQDKNPTILLGCHYDSRIYADRDEYPFDSGGVPGANDGASGVAVLLELMRTLPSYTVPIWMVFFDTEDNYGLEGWEGSVGSRIFVDNLKSYPQSVVIIDMVGDADLALYYETNSDPFLSRNIWSTALELNYHQFIPEVKYSIMDDHLPFLKIGIPSVLIIDFDFPYWHTLSDTEDKVSPESLAVVGDTLWTWITNYTK